MIRAFQPCFAKWGSEAWIVPYSPSTFTRCMSWNRFIGVFSTDDHHIAPLLYITTSSLPYVFTVSLTMLWTLSESLVSTGIAAASLPASLISRATVLIVEAGEFGSGGKGSHLEASDVVLAETTTTWSQQCTFP